MLLPGAGFVDDVVEVEIEGGDDVHDREEARVRGPVLQLSPRVHGQADSAGELFIREVFEAFETRLAKQRRKTFASGREFGWRRRSTGPGHEVAVYQYR